jgi:WD40 repeat protein/serine/threonine protein kinase
MECRLLGSLEVSDNGCNPSLGGPKQRTVLAHLLLRPNQVVTADRLIDEIWGDHPPAAARSTLQGYVSHLRKALGPGRLEGRSGGYVLHVDPAQIDAVRFEALVKEGRDLVAADPAAAAFAFGEALSLWRGPAINDLSQQASLQPEIARLEELRMEAVEGRIGAELSLGRHVELVAELETLVASYPLRERLWSQLMTALYRAGRQADALAAFQRTRVILAQELGIDPSPELERVHGRILRQDPALDIAGQPLRGYRLLEQVGAGAFGSVHRAFQPEVGREVAVKVIHTRFANDPEFIRRFETEAQLVARLEHPHIVPLYDFWREPEGAYLVMRYLRGGSLREHLAEGPLESQRVARLLDQLAPALSAAHRQGIVHRDVKPGNILFDEEGNAYLSDFGIAKDLATAVSDTPSPTPRPHGYYLSPEEIKGDPVTPQTDIYTMGVVLFEALSGRHPFAATAPEEIAARHLRDPIPPLTGLRQDLPKAVDDVVARATAKDPALRYPDAVSLAVALRQALTPGVRPLPAPRTDVPNPYKGLRPFFEADAPDFFGREVLTGRVLARLRQEGEGSRFLAVVGPSGSGKSSLVRAGVIPAVKDGALPGSDHWYTLEIHPGAHPFEELAAGLTRIAVHPPSSLVERMERDDGGFLQVVDDILPPGSELLLVIDQFEEVFTFVEHEEQRARFLSLLVAGATDPGSRVRVLITLRADFYDRPLAYKRFGELVLACNEGVTPLSVGELERAVTGPAERVGVDVDPSLVVDIVSEVAAHPGALPLLQYALTEMFERRSDSRLTLEAYGEIGGVSGALARRAETLYDRLNRAGKDAARQLFLRLVTVGDEGSADTRRRVLRTELASLDVDSESMNTVVDAFGARRLLTFDRDPVTRGPTVEVAHEALISEWGRLRGWIEGAREDLRAHRRLSSAADEWAGAGRDQSFLLRGDRLARFESWAQISGLALTGIERDYLDVSVNQRDAERRDEEARRARERQLKLRSRVTLRALVAVFAVLTLVASGLTVLTLHQANRARTEARLATARELAGAAVANLEVDPQRSILLALEAVDATRDKDGFVVREAEEALHRAVQLSRIIRVVPRGGNGLAVSSDGSRFATTGADPADNTATVWDIETGKRLLVLTGPDVGRPAVAFSPDDRLIATSHKDGTVRLWDGDTGEQVRSLRGPAGPVATPSFSPDGKLLASAGPRAVRVWEVAGGRRETVLTADEDLVTKAEFSPGGSRLAAGSIDGTATIWDLGTESTVTLTGHEFPVSDVAFSPDGSRVATSSWDGTIRVWDARSGASHRTFVEPVSLMALDYSPDGTRVAAVGTDAIARVWDAETGRQLLRLAGHTGTAVNVAFVDENRLLTAGLDNTTRVWDVSATGGRDWITVPIAKRIYTGVAFSPDGTSFAAPAEPKGVTIWETRTGEEVKTLRGPEEKLTNVSFSPDGSRLAAGSDLTVAPPVWDTETGELLYELQGHQAPVRAIDFSPDGTRLVTGSFDGTARVWDAATGTELAVLEAGTVLLTVAFSPDGRSIVTGGEDGTPTVWDSAEMKQVRKLRGHKGPIEGVTFGRDGLFITTSDDGTAKVWDFESGRDRLTFRGHGTVVHQAAVSRDGTQVATTSVDRTTKIWDPKTGREHLTLFGHEDEVYGVDFSPDGRLIATASPDGTVDLHLLPIEDFLRSARGRLIRSLTDEECRRYLHTGACP